MTAPDPLRHIGGLIRRTQQLHAVLWAATVSEQVSSVQYAALEVLEAMPGASQKELGARLGLDRSTIADIVRRMERSGLIERTRASQDRRRNVLRLSTQGEHAYATLTPKVDQLQQELVVGLAPEDTATLRRLLLEVLASHPLHASG